MALINPPPLDAVDFVENGKATQVKPGWRNFFVAVFNICNALTMSGPTAQRPTTLLWPGRMFFDTSLGANGRPIWVNKLGTGWVFSDGTAA